MSEALESGPFLLNLVKRMCIKMNALIPHIEIDIVKKSKNGEITEHIHVNPDGSEEKIVNKGE